MCPLRYGACQWGGPHCNELQFLPQPTPQGYGQNPKVWSWGGNVLPDPSGNLFHLFVAEMVENCSLRVRCPVAMEGLGVVGALGEGGWIGEP